MKKFTYLLLSLFCIMGGVTKAYAGIGEAYDTSDWTITASTNAPNTGNEGNIAKAFDNNNSTFWHSDWTGNDGKTNPHWIVIDTKSPNNTFGGITYLPRQDRENGFWNAYKIYVSNTPFENLTKESVLALPTTDLKKEGTLTGNKKQLREIGFDKEETGQYILIVITDGSGDNGQFATCAELTVNKFASTVPVTYTYTIAGAQNTVEKTVNQVIGSDYNPPAMDFVTFDPVEGTVKEGDNKVTVNCTQNLPFAITTDLQSPKWTTVNMHNWNNFSYQLFWKCEDNNIDVNLSKENYDYNILKDDAHLWCFYGNLFDGFEIYNKKAGTQNSLNNTATQATITEGEHTKWNVKTSTAVPGCPAFTADGTNYLNAKEIGTEGAKLKYWTSADGGSTCRAFAPADFLMEMVENVVNIPENAVGGYRNIESIDPALTAFEKDEFNITNAIALGDAITALKSNNVNFTPGDYYRIVSAFPEYENKQNVKKCMFSQAGQTNIQWGNLSMTDINNVFQLEEKGENTFYLKNANRNAYMQGVLGLLGEKQNAGDLTFEALGNAQYKVKFGDQICHTNGHNNGAGQNGNLVNWSGALNSASAWYIVKVTEVEVALNDADDASYATAYLPFAVSSVQDATAYIGTKKDETTLQATAVESGIPANTGVILKGEAGAGKAVLTLGDATSDTEGSALTGTLVEKDYSGELVFGAKDNVPGFYTMAEGSKIGANKAYLAAAAQAMKLVFDGDVTGIESITGEAAGVDAPVYDLTGRRVMKAVKGGLYIQNGRKFIAR